MRRNFFFTRWINISFLLAALTVVVSLSVSYASNGSVFDTVRMTQLRNYGGTTFDLIGHWELWRIPAAQLIHSKMPHMLYNVLCLYLLGVVLERRLGGLRIFLLWLIAGGLSTLLSPIWISPPHNVGTGASQATFALAGCAAVLAPLTGQAERARLLFIGALILIPGILLDFYFAGYLKPGHIAGFFMGGLFGFAYRNAWKSSITLEGADALTWQ